ncbi:adenylate/guanylate cyclase domain-containing protein [Mycobacterium talmoniae]|uniref:Adenylate cyclase 2 n=1 Tax=Mycobacterium talmoniae TaxID=1858794 RepID=A0A1S1NNV8_9MYCO|nr:MULTISPECIES: adenylate/guanylate cyclase domain-containing protein [Mycobacterium]OHV05873.1 hypothetical protein BKN37_04050 [Mycobacterium talmoniae]PQM48221.1 Adenylate cyclase 2 [Mycobacterium talmoniae]TDH57777.1 adenylate/guanylate cyclase domain-containing protein [Mycobacterium eburneum]
MTACDAPIAVPPNAIEYRQVTVLFVKVAQSMDVAAALGAERFHEVMAALGNCAAMVVRRYGGIVDKVTGSGVVALFGTPVAVTDHAVRACFAALDIQTETQCLSGHVENSDGVVVQLRAGLNSGRMLLEGDNPQGHTALGDDVGLAQRMQSVAPPGGVMLAESTARLVHTLAVLGEREMVKGTHAQVPARRLISMAHGTLALA